MIMLINVCALNIGSFAYAEDASEELEEVTLKIAFQGDRPVAFDDIIAAIEEASKDELNIKIEDVWIPWLDYSSKMSVALAAGDEYDLVFTVLGENTPTWVSSDYFIPLDDLIEEYGQNIVETRGEQMMDANMFQGSDGEYRQYVIPMANAANQGFTYLIRKDIREALGFDPVESFDELIELAYAIRDSEYDVIPMTATSTCDFVRCYFVCFGYDSTFSPAGIDLFRNSPLMKYNFILYMANNDGQVYNLFDDRDESFWNMVLLARELVEDGVLYDEVMSMSGSSLAYEGKVGITVSSDFGVKDTWQNLIQAVDSSYEWEAFAPVTLEPQTQVSEFRAFNFMGVPYTSDNAERAVMFLDWLCASQENYDLAAYGIEGETYELTEDGSYRYLTSDYYWFPFLWVWNPTLDRHNANFTDEVNEIYDFYADFDNFIPSVYTGFTFNTDPVANEMAQIANCELEYWLPLVQGVADPETTWEAFKEDYYDVFKVVQTELERQLEEFLSMQ